MAQQGMTLRNRLDNCRDVIDNPIAVQIAMVAPSANAADEYVRNLGWSNEMAAQVSQLTHFFQEQKGIEKGQRWKDIIASSKRPVFEMADFSNLLSPFRNEVHMQTVRKFGRDIMELLTEQPLLTRELRTSGGHAECFTTLDAKNCNCFQEVKGQEWWRWFNPGIFGGCAVVFDSRDFSGEWVLKPSNEHGGDWADHFHIIIEPVCCSTEGDWRPRFFKRIQYTREIEDSSPSAFDRVRLRIRMDYGSETKLASIGMLSFERAILLGRCGESYDETYKVLVARTFYEIGFDWTARLCRDLNFQLSIFQTEERANFPGRRTRTSLEEAGKLLSPIYSSLLERDKPVLLENIAGATFLEKKPEELLSYFI